MRTNLPALESSPLTSGRRSCGSTGTPLPSSVPHASVPHSYWPNSVIAPPAVRLVTKDSDPELTTKTLRRMVTTSCPPSPLGTPPIAVGPFVVSALNLSSVVTNFRDGYLASRMPSLSPTRSQVGFPSFDPAVLPTPSTTSR